MFQCYLSFSALRAHVLRKHAGHPIANDPVYMEQVKAAAGGGTEEEDCAATASLPSAPSKRARVDDADAAPPPFECDSSLNLEDR